MAEKKRVAIIDNSIDTTGALKAILYYCEYTKDNFHFLFFLPTGSRATAHLTALNYEVIELPFLEISKNWKSLLNYLPRLCGNAFLLRKILSEKQIDLVHVNDFYNLVAVMARISGAKYPIITHVRFMPDRFPAPLVKLWMRLNLKYADQIICVSNAVKNCLTDHEKIKVIYDSLRHVSHPPKKTYQQKKNIQLLYLAHYIPGKGQNYALEAFSKAFLQNSKLRLKFVGGDMGLEKNQKFRETLVRRTKLLGLQHVVHFCGPTNDVYQELSEADIMLNFSESESFSMTCLEALSNGVPLIATDCGGPAELFVHEESGWLVPNRDIPAICDAILRLSEDSKMLQKFSQNSINYVSGKFSKENTFLHTIRYYNALLGSDS